jgi:thioredoxin reductase
MADHYDTIIIGAGLAGLTAGALLAAEEKQKVLILEREQYLGGRLLSFAVEDGQFKLTRTIPGNHRIQKSHGLGIRLGDSRRPRSGNHAGGRTIGWVQL